MKLKAENQGVCVKHFNYVVLSAQATLNASTGYVPFHTVSLFTLRNYTLNKLHFYI